MFTNSTTMLSCFRLSLAPTLMPLHCVYVRGVRRAVSRAHWEFIADSSALRINDGCVGGSIGAPSMADGRGPRVVQSEELTGAPQRLHASGPRVQVEDRAHPNPHTACDRWRARDYNRTSSDICHSIPEATSASAASAPVPPQVRTHVRICLLQVATHVIDTLST